jgi:hypothetical protein
MLFRTLLIGGLTFGLPVGAKPTNPLAVVPPSPSVLSVLRTRGGHLEWLRVDPVKHLSATVATLPKECGEAGDISWSHDRKKALVWITRYSKEGQAPCEVVIATGKIHILAVPPDADLIREIADKCVLSVRR